MLIARASLRCGRAVDVRIARGRIVALGDLQPAAGEPVLEAEGGLLLPGLHDHHAHLMATAASLQAIRCGPPHVPDAAALAAALSRAAASGEGWLRGIGYHDSVAGPIDRHWLDRVVPDRPLRIQHRSGRLWIVNSAGVHALLAGGGTPPESLERDASGFSGRLFDDDGFLRRALGGVPPPLGAVGGLLARRGVTGVTDMTPCNDRVAAAHLAAQHAAGALPQRLVLAGTEALGDAPLDPAVSLGPLKLHLHEAHLPPYDAIVARMRAAHQAGRAVAVHCVTECELVFTLAALREAGPVPGDRIEHASVSPRTALDEIAALGLAVVTQPNFVRERGDAYRAAIPASDWPDLYRLRSVLQSGITLAGGTDAPFGEPDPWAAMADAVSRRTEAGQELGIAEALSPEQALDLFGADPLRLDRQRQVAVGAPADLCLLRVGWARARTALSADLVRATLIDGRIVHEHRLEQPAA